MIGKKKEVPQKLNFSTASGEFERYVEGIAISCPKKPVHIMWIGYFFLKSHTLED
jgi:hypothetical protein